jgi:hypothetical protein
MFAAVSASLVSGADAASARRLPLVVIAPTRKEVEALMAPGGRHSAGSASLAGVRGSR